LLLSEQEIFGGGGFAGGTVTEQSLTTQVGEKIPRFLSNAFKAFEPDLTRDVEKPPKSQILDVASVFSFPVQTRRVQRLVTNAEQANDKSAAFGGFSSAQKQESELQKALAQSRARFPQFFKLPDTGKQAGLFIQGIDSSGRDIR